MNSSDDTMMDINFNDTFYDNPCLVFINSTHYYDVCGCDVSYQTKAQSNQTLSDYNNGLIIRTLYAILLVTAMCGIILTIIVLSRKHMCTSTNCYLISLAVADLGFLVFLSTKWLETEVSDYLTFDIYYRYAQIFIDTFLMASVWVTVMLAIERYIAICHSLRASTICTVKRARIINVSVFIFAFVCRIPNFFEYDIKTGFYECKEKQFIDITALGRNVNYKIIYAWIFDCTLCAVVPFIALLYLNVRLIVEIRKSTHYLLDTSGAAANLHNVLGREQRRVTLMLISIIIVFFICQAPYVSVMAFRSLGVRYTMLGVTSIVSIINEVTIFLLTLKSALNFILYCWFSEKFWDTFKKELCRKICIFFKRNREMFNSRSHSDTHHNSTNPKSFRKSTKTTAPIRDIQC